MSAAEAVQPDLGIRRGGNSGLRFLTGETPARAEFAVTPAIGVKSAYEGGR
jgi:hypothetical protein